MDKSFLDMNVPRQPTEELSLTDGVRLDQEQQALVLAGSWAKRLLEKEVYRKVTATLIAARQLYALGYIELQHMLEAEKDGKSEADWPHPMVEDYFIQAAMREAAKPFSEHALMEGLVKTVMPFLGDIVDRHAAEDVAKAEEYHQAVEKERRTRGIPIGFLIDPEDEAPEIPRHRPLSLAGWSKAVYWVLQEIAQSVSANAYNVVHLVDGHIRIGPGHVRLTRVGRSLWGGCSDTTKKMTIMMAALLDKMSGPPDLIVCDNLAQAYTMGYQGRPAAANAGDGNKGIFRWCKQAGCALLGGVPLDDPETPDVSHPAFEQLRTFTKLRPISIQSLPDDKLRLRIGRSQHHWDVDRSQVVSAGPSNILVARRSM